jgi:hypothetical protein
MFRPQAVLLQVNTQHKNKIKYIFITCCLSAGFKFVYTVEWNGKNLE